jgi:hypothetical protein
MSSWFIVRSSAGRIKHVRGLVRAGAYLLGLTMVFGALRVRSARADVEDRTVQLGRQMMTLANAAEHDVNKVTLNGQTMFIGNSIGHDTAEKILDRYQAYCEANAAQPPESWRELSSKDGAKTEKKKWLPTGVMRGGDNHEGTVVCFTKTAKSKQSIVEAAKAFADTGDLGMLGAARYVYVKQTEQGNTHVLTAWTDETFSLSQLVGEEDKDVPGQDFGGEIPRVASSRRAFSARLEDTGFGVNVYQSKEEPAKIVEHFDYMMQGQGWSAVDPELERHEEGGPPRVGRLYEKNMVVLTLTAVRASADPKDGTFTVLGLAGVTSGGGITDPGALAGAVKKQRTAPAAK